MASRPIKKSINVDIDAAKRDSQDGIVENIAARVRERAVALRFNARSLGEAVGVPSSSAHNYWNGTRSWPAEKLGQLAEILRTNVDVLVTGRDASRGHLIAADDADWVEVPEYALLEIDERGKLDPISVTMLRRDWLYTSLGDSKGLWIGRLPAPYEALALGTGTALFCKDIGTGERMIDGAFYLFRINGGITMSRFSFRAGVARSGERLSEHVVLSHEIGVDEDQYQPVARVLGQLARPI